VTQQRIRILHDTTINQIAAGEVIEHPASVVKELVENAIDAGASQIAIETKAGGRGLIKVVDDGCGMGEDDLILSVERHATSKIVEVGELNSLKTLGFRGEALPSIASVSKMTLHSASVSGEGTLLQIEAGKIVKLNPYPRRKGTTVEVKSLFYNVPVRKKFQKSLGWDTGETHKLLIKFALCYPSLGFSWINDEKQVMVLTPLDTCEERVKTLLGEEFMNNSFPVEQENGSLLLCGRISRPTYHRPNRMGQYLFINQRAVISPFIVKKVVESYGTRLSPHRHPLFVLHLTLPPSWIDVNVHPQKKEIRIREEQKLSFFILEAIGQALEQRDGVKFNLATVAPSLISGFAVAEPRAEYTASQEETYYFPADPPARLPAKSGGFTSGFELLPPKVTLVGKVKNYLFIEECEGIRVVDGARAMERVIFEELNEMSGKQEVQTLLLPIQLTVTGKERALLCEHLNSLNDRGISVRHFGKDTFIVDAIPAVLEPDEIPDLIYAYLEEGALPRCLGRCLKRKDLSFEAGAALIEKLFRCKNPEYTPTGKRIHYLLDENALGKML
jgi:DNA mismatch repair protein MutL